MARTWTRAAVPLVLAAVVGTAMAGDGAFKKAPVAAGPRRVHAYDAAGRLVRTGDGAGRFVTYAWDAAGNSTATAATRWWHAGVKKPEKGAWVFGVTGDGTLEGHGADVTRGVYRLSGSLDLETGAGTVALAALEGGAPLGTFTIEGVKTKAAPGGGVASFSATGSSTTLGSLALAAVTPAGAMGGFSGRFASVKNAVKVGTAKAAPGTVDFSPAGVPAEGSAIAGGVTGLLLRDPKGLAYGTVRWDGDDFRVSGKVKDGAKSVKLKSGKGAPVKFLLQVKP